ncbi:MAG TPA: carboxypeptidase-like regulatory domain-containing protein, partial [Terriglobales bacterium]|nr:carboxypeptidase-like regulatory domain-containing protein [Terriglobales bacterium]
LAMQFETGTIQGVVSDDQGPVAKASIEARNVMSGAVTKTESNSRGEYKLDDLHYGRYSLWVQAPAHSSTWILKITVEKGKVTRRDIHLLRDRTTTSGLRGSPRHMTHVGL